MRKLVVALLFILNAYSISWASQKPIPSVSTKVSLEMEKGKTVEKAIFEATFVLNPETLKSLVIEAKTEVKDLARKKGKVSLNLNIPENYLVQAMTMYEEIDISTNTLVLYQLYQGERLKLFEDRVTTAGPGHRTPEGNFCLKRIVHMPWYFPPKEWGGGTDPVKPGRKNPYGNWMAEILKVSPQPAGYETHPKGGLTKNGIRQHSTNAPRSIGSYASHGCVRIHPDKAERLFPFMLHFTPHREAKKVFRGDAVYPFKEGNLIYVKIYRSKKTK